MTTITSEKQFSCQLNNENDIKNAVKEAGKTIPSTTSTSPRMFVDSLPHPPKLPIDYELRELTEHDYDLGFVDLLEQLTTTQPLSRQQFLQRLCQLRGQNPPGYHIFVIEKLRFFERT
jgi:hypothetical protein